MNKIDGASLERPIFQTTMLADPIHRKEVLQLIANFLLVADLLESWQELQQKNKSPPDAVQASRELRDTIMSGSWEKAINLLHSLVNSHVPDIEAVKKESSSDLVQLLKDLFSHMIYEQYFLELMNADRVNEAVALLREKLANYRKSPLNTTRSVDDLCLVLVESNKSKWYRDLEWDPEELCSRLQLLNNIRLLLHMFIKGGLEPTRLSDLMELGMKGRTSHWDPRHLNQQSTVGPYYLAEVVNAPSPQFPTNLWSTNTQWHFHQCLFSPSGKYLAALAQPLVTGSSVDSSSNFVLLLFVCPQTSQSQYQVNRTEHSFNGLIPGKESSNNKPATPQHQTWSLAKMQTFREFDCSWREMQLEWRYDNARVFVATAHTVFVFTVPSLSMEKFPRPLRDDGGSDKLMRCIPYTDLIFFATEGGQCRVVTSQNQNIRLSGDATFRTKYLALHLSSDVIASTHSPAHVSSNSITYPLRLFVVDYLQRIRCLTWLVSERFAMNMSRRLLKEHLQLSKEETASHMRQQSSSAATTPADDATPRIAVSTSSRGSQQGQQRVNLVAEIGSSQRSEEVAAPVMSLEEVANTMEEEEEELEEVEETDELLEHSSNILRLLMESAVSNTNSNAPSSVTTSASSGRSAPVAYSPRFRRYNAASPLVSTTSPTDTVSGVVATLQPVFGPATTTSVNTSQPQQQRALLSRSNQVVDLTTSSDSATSTSQHRDLLEALNAASSSGSDVDPRFVRQLVAAAWYAGLHPPGVGPPMGAAARSSTNSASVATQQGGATSIPGGPHTATWQSRTTVVPPLANVTVDPPQHHHFTPPSPFSQATAYVQLGGGVTAAIYAPPQLPGPYVTTPNLSPLTTAPLLQPTWSHPHLAAALLRAFTTGPALFPTTPNYGIPTQFTPPPPPPAPLLHPAAFHHLGHPAPSLPPLAPTLAVPFPPNLTLHQRMVHPSFLVNRVPSLSPVVAVASSPSPEVYLGPQIPMLPSPAVLPNTTPIPAWFLDSAAFTSGGGMITSTEMASTGSTSNTVETSSGGTSAGVEPPSAASRDRRRQYQPRPMAPLSSSMLLPMGLLVSSTTTSDTSDSLHDHQSAYSASSSPPPPPQVESADDVLLVPNMEEVGGSMFECVIQSPDEVMDIQVSPNAQWLLTLHKHCLRVWNAASGNLLRDLTPTFIPNDTRDFQRVGKRRVGFFEQKIVLCGAMREFVAAVTDDERVVFWRYLSSGQSVHEVQLSQSGTSSASSNSSTGRSDDLEELATTTCCISCCPTDISLMAVITADHSLHFWNAQRPPHGGKM